jgi:N-acetyl-alpha-D-muramate 1-phosphate uridylyltransferase
MKAMILAAGRGERMRPLSDATPKPLLRAGGKSLILRQIEKLVRAGFDEIVINVSHHGAAIEAELGDGSRLGAAIRYSREPEPLEVAGGIATARPLLGDGVVLIVSGDLYAGYDYATLAPRVRAMATTSAPPHAHLVMVPNPAYHSHGDFALVDGRLAIDDADLLTFGNIALYRVSLFQRLPSGRKIAMLPLFREWIGRGWVSGELYRGPWVNVGTPRDLADLDAALTAAGAGLAP